MPRVGLTPERIVAEAAQLADLDGLEAVTPAALARRLGVRPASIYAHLGGVDDLRQRLLALSLEESADAVAAAVLGRAGADALAAAAHAHRDWALSHPGRYAASRIPAGDSPAVLAAGRRHSDLIGAALRAYGLAPDRLTHVVRLYGSIVHGFVALEIAGAFDRSEPSPSSSWDAAVEVLARAVSAWAA